MSNLGSTNTLQIKLSKTKFQQMSPQQTKIQLIQRLTYINSNFTSTIISKERLFTYFAMQCLRFTYEQCMTNEFQIKPFASELSEPFQMGKDG